MRGTTMRSLVLVFLGGCGAEAPAPELEIVAFDQIYENWAWGYDSRGIAIDQDGEVFVWSRAGLGPWSDPDPLDGFTREDRIARYGALNYVERLSQAEVDAMRQAAAGLGGGPFSVPQSVAADAGECLTNAAVFVAVDDGYAADVLLLRNGDWLERNLAPGADAVADWVDAIARRHGAHFCGF